MSFVSASDDVYLAGNESYQQWLKYELEGENDGAAVNVVAGLPEVPTPASPDACRGTCDGLSASYPLYTSYLSVTVRKQRAANDFTRLFSPFDASVYWAAALTVLSLAASLVALKVINPRTCKGYRVNVRSFTDALYHAVLSTLGGEDDSAPWPSGPARLIRIVSAFFALVLVAAYTANLAAFFTAP